MEINCNQLRLDMVKQFNELVSILNAGLLPTNTIIEDSAGGNIQGDLLLNSNNIAELLNDLRTSVVFLACSYLPGNDEFKDLSKELGEVLNFEPNDY